MGDLSDKHADTHPPDQPRKLAGWVDQLDETDRAVWDRWCESDATHVWIADRLREIGVEFSPEAVRRWRVTYG